MYYVNYIVVNIFANLNDPSFIKIGDELVANALNSFV